MIDYANTLRVVVLKCERYEMGFDFQGELNGLITTLQTIRDAIPQEYRDVAEFDIDSRISYGDTSDPTIEISYRRPITLEEREAAEAKKKANAAARLEQAQQNFDEAVRAARAAGLSPDPA